MFKKVVLSFILSAVIVFLSVPVFAVGDGEVVLSAKSAERAVNLVPEMFDKVTNLMNKNKKSDDEKTEPVIVTE